MTDEKRTQAPDELDPAVADCIERALTASPHESALEGDQPMWREVWGALPETLEPAAPLSETWDQIRTRLQPESREQVPAPANDQSWETMASRLAAILIVGLLVTATWLGNQVRIKDQRIAALQQEVTLSTAGFIAQASVPAVSAANVGFVAADSIESCSLEAQGESQGARGWMYMGGAEPSCFLAVEGLQPLAEGQIYRAWFRSQGQAVPLGVVELSGGRGEMFSTRIPASVDAVFITVESASDQATAPKGPTVLYGDALIASL